MLRLRAASSLRARPIAGWALRRDASAACGCCCPLVTRALPLLLLFITFLFINAEVWQVSSALDGGVLWLTVLLFFGVAAVLFLLLRLPEEVDAVDDAVDAADLCAACHGTPLESAAQRLVDDDDSTCPSEAQVTGLQTVNLVLVLLIAQAVQVLLLAFAVFVFFIVFGAVAIDDGVHRVLDGRAGDPRCSVPRRCVSEQLLQVSVFLAAFSGLYFTVVRGHRRDLPQAVLHGVRTSSSGRSARARHLPSPAARAAPEPE